MREKPKDVTQMIEKAHSKKITADNVDIESNIRLSKIKEAKRLQA
jgi:hypothetical protein